MRNKLKEEQKRVREEVRMSVVMMMMMKMKQQLMMFLSDVPPETQRVSEAAAGAPRGSG